MGSTLMDGTEQTLFEASDVGEYAGYIFLDDMKPNDRIVIRVYVKDPEDSVYKRWGETTYNYGFDDPTIHFQPMQNRVGYKVTAEQTLGSYRTITHTWFKK